MKYSLIWLVWKEKALIHILKELKRYGRCFDWGSNIFCCERQYHTKWLSFSILINGYPLILAKNVQESFVVRIYRLNILYRIFCGLKRVLLIKYADRQTERLIVVVMPTFPSLLFSYKSSTLFTSTYWRQASRPIFFI